MGFAGDGIAGEGLVAGGRRWRPTALRIYGTLNQYEG
jgi:hypothetical protein